MSGKIVQVKVISKAGDKTVVGLHTFMEKHPIYEKYVKKQKKYMIHDEENVTKVGDLIEIMESRPLSKKKSWVVVNNRKAGEK
ncbi:MAG TPA: 30S ribosomal protein S17 [Rickettsiales bacterium]|nr:30S ribosomal protein S17 [Rickettsiales bacterium]